MRSEFCVIMKLKLQTIAGNHQYLTGEHKMFSSLSTNTETTIVTVTADVENIH